MNSHSLKCILKSSVYLTIVVYQNNGRIHSHLCWILNPKDDFQTCNSESVFYKNSKFFLFEISTEIIQHAAAKIGNYSFLSLLFCRNFFQIHWVYFIWLTKWIIVANKHWTISTVTCAYFINSLNIILWLLYCLHMAYHECSDSIIVQ